MAAVIYIKVTDPRQHSTVTLVCLKSKVAPLERMSIPRLELTAALLLARLMRYVTDILHKPNQRTYLWTDSSVMLTWISSHPSRWKDFVRNRVSTIQDLSPNSVWRFVPVKVNPADCASRGLTISQLQKHELWWTGSQLLLKDQQHWPTQCQSEDSSTHLEERPGFSLIVAAAQPKYHWEIIDQFSSLTRLLRATAVCSRVSQIIKKLPKSTLRHPLTPQDIEKSRIFWIKATQAAYFSQELKLITTQELPPAHPLRSLAAFVDTQGVLRVGGRLVTAYE